jgi:hypothetical protein
MAKGYPVCRAVRLARTATTVADGLYLVFRDALDGVDER